MNPRQQVPQRETCQAMQEVKIEFDSYFAWIGANDPMVGANRDYGIMWNKIPAPTVLELLEKIPKDVLKHQLVITTSTNYGYYVRYDSMAVTDKYLKIIRDHNLVEALAQMLLWLKEKGYLK